ncbi:MAG: hypothetical protein QXD70_03475 [Candidatus Bathyarchaeia archaeon]
MSSVVMFSIIRTVCIAGEAAAILKMTLGVGSYSSLMNCCDIL